MKVAIVLLAHLFVPVAVLLRPGGPKTLLAENLLLKQQLLVLQRSRRCAPNLRWTVRLWFGFWPVFLNPRRLLRAAIVVKPATLLRCHRRLKALKDRFLYSSHPQIDGLRKWAKGRARRATPVETERQGRKFAV